MTSKRQFGSRLVSVSSAEFYSGPLDIELERSIIPVLLNEAIVADEGYSIVVKVVAVSIPHSFYGLTAKDNTFVLTINGTSKSISITPGQYSVFKFRTTVQTAMTAAFAGTGLTVPVLSFDPIASTFVLSPVIGNDIALDFTVENSMGKALGFFNLNYPPLDPGTGSIVLTSSPLSSVKAPILALASGNLYIHSDLPNRYNLATATSIGSQNSLLQVITINAPYNAFITLDAMAYATPLYVSSKVINYFFLFLRDASGSLIDLRGVDWNVTLEISIEELPVEPEEFERQEASESTIDNIVNENNISDIPLMPPVKRKRVMTEQTDIPSVPQESSVQPEDNRNKKISNYMLSEIVDKFAENE